MNALVSDGQLLGLAVAALALFLGSAAQGSVGFGLGLVAGPVLIMINPAYVPGPLLLLSFPIATMTMWRERKQADIGRVRWALAGRLVGTGLGTAAVVLLPATGLAIVVACVILAAVGVSMTGVSLRVTTGNLIVAGVISGVTGTTSSIGGPPIALLYQSEAGGQVRGALGLFMAFGAGVSLLGLWMVGRLGPTEFRLAAVMVPAVLAGYWVAGTVRHHVDGGRMRAAILAFATVAGVSVLWRSVS